MTASDIEAWEEFLNDPEHAPIRDTASRFPPWELFKLETTDQIVSVCGFFEDGTLRVYIDPEHNDPDDFRTGFEVFGIDPDDLAKHTQPA